MKKLILVFGFGLLITPAVVLVVIRGGFVSTAATASPARWETDLASSALRASLHRHAPDLKNPIPISDETLLAGMKAFRSNCAGCHGECNRPSSWGTKGFYPRVPQFADDPSKLSDAEMFFVIKHGVRYSGMGAWDGMISDTEIWQIVSFLTNIKSLPAPVEEAWKK